jgi:hypothetical protein
MVALLPRRAAFTAVLVAGSLATAAALIVWQTGGTSTTAETELAQPALEGPTTDPPVAPSVAPTSEAETVTLGAPAALDVDAVESERTQAAAVRALVAGGQIGKARARANAYYERFPHGPSTAELERLTGAHPRRDATDTRR